MGKPGNKKEKGKNITGCVGKRHRKEDDAHKGGIPDSRETFPLQKKKCRSSGKKPKKGETLKEVRGGKKSQKIPAVLHGRRQ